LGESTSKWANYPKFIAWAFQGLPWIQRRNLKVEAYSTGFEAHTSLDSYYKYKYLYNDYDFDLIIVYHGVNELRANNCPPDMFKTNYSHFSYYSVLNPVMKLMDIPVLNRSFLFLRIALTWEELKREKREKSHPQTDAFIPANEPNPEWLQYGTDIRSAQPFRQNLEKIIELAQKRAQPVLLMTYAYVIPPDYSVSAFQNGALGYGSGMDAGVPLEIYGSIAGVGKGLKAHNLIVEELAQRYGCYFIDQAKLLDDNPDYFIDVCHFSQNGIMQFAINIGRYFLKIDIKAAEYPH
jgi:hypothetical protein